MEKDCSDPSTLKLSRLLLKAKMDASLLGVKSMPVAPPVVRHPLALPVVAKVLVLRSSAEAKRNTVSSVTKEPNTHQVVVTELLESAIIMILAKKPSGRK